MNASHADCWACAKLPAWDGKPEFTALLHHVDVFALSVAFFGLKKTAAVGIDAVTWRDYEQNVEAFS